LPRDSFLSVVAGFYQVSNVDACLSVVAGFYQVSNVDACLSVVAGFYQVSNVDACLLIVAGFYQVSNVDDVLVYHTDFLNSCLKDCMLTTPDLLKIVHKLMMVCVTFSNFVQVKFVQFLWLCLVALPSPMVALGFVLPSCLTHITV
jgi:hypothetical protein